MEDITRRDFLKGLAALAVVAGLPIETIDNLSGPYLYDANAYLMLGGRRFVVDSLSITHHPPLVSYYSSPSEQSYHFKGNENTDLTCTCESIESFSLPATYLTQFAIYVPECKLEVTGQGLLETHYSTSSRKPMVDFVFSNVTQIVVRV